MDLSLQTILIYAASGMNVVAGVATIAAALLYPTPDERIFLCLGALIASLATARIAVRNLPGASWANVIAGYGLMFAPPLLAVPAASGYTIFGLIAVILALVSASIPVTTSAARPR